MSTPTLYNFYLRDSVGNYYQQTPTGALLLSSDKVALRYAPRDWDKIKYKFGRSVTWWGIKDAVVSEMQFHSDAAFILRSLMYGGGMADYEADVRLLIERRIDGNINTWQYEYFFEGRLLLPEMEDGGDEFDTFFTVNAVRHGLAEVMEANKNTVYELGFDNPEVISVLLQGLKLYAKYKYLTGTLPSFEVINNTQQWSFPAAVIPLDGENYVSQLMQWQTVNGGKWSTSGTPDDSNKFLFTSIDFNSTITVNARFDVASNVTNNTFKLDILQKNTNDNTVSVYQNIFTSSVFGSGVSTPMIISTSFSLAFDEGNQDLEYFLNARVTRTGGGGDGTSNILITSFEMLIDFNFNIPDTTCSGYRYYNFARRLFEKVAPNYTFRSDFLNTAIFDINDLNAAPYYQNAPYLTVVTSGDNIRGTTDRPQLIKTKWDDLAQDVWSRWMLAIGIEGDTLRMEPLSYFLNKSVSLGDIIQVNNLKKTIAQELIPTSIKLGYEDQDYGSIYDSINGRDEVASTQFYKTPVTTITKEEDLVSPYRADPRGIEAIRVQQFQNNTRDTPADNDVFLLGISLEQSGSNYKLLKYATGIFNTVAGNTIYNVGLYPHRFLYRHAGRYKGILNAIDGVSSFTPAVTFQSGLKNTAFRTTVGGAVIAEHGIFYPAATPYTIPDKLFIPLFLTFDGVLTNTIIQNIVSNPYGYLTIQDKYGNIYYGFIWDIDITLGGENEPLPTNIKLLCAPQTVLPVI